MCLIILIIVLLVVTVVVLGTGACSILNATGPVGHPFNGPIEVAEVVTCWVWWLYLRACVRACMCKRERECQLVSHQK